MSPTSRRTTPADGRRLADPAMLVEVELVVDLAGSPVGKPLLEKFNVESHPGDFYQGVIVNGARLLYLAGQIANNPDGSVAGVGDWRRQAEKIYENIGHVLRAAGATPASAVKETTWAPRSVALSIRATTRPRPWSRSRGWRRRSSWRKSK
jgi:enamine deaminase RidA (YjgF/YER057c/UK114 family)